MSDATSQRANAPASTSGLAVFAAAPALEAIRDHLTRLQRPAATAQVGGPAEAAAWCASNEQPTTLLVDVEAEAHPLSALLALAEQTGPACRIIAIGARQDVDLYRQLLAGGIFDYLLKPVRLDLLADTLARADEDVPLGQTGAARAGRTAAFVGTAGGLGCSTLVASLGQWLAQTRQTPTVLVDFDRRKGDLPLLLGLEADAGLATLLDAPSVDPRLLQRTLLADPAAANTRLHLLAQRPGAETPIPEERTLEIGGALGQLFSLSLWDIPSHRPTGSDDVLAQAEIRVVLTELSVQGARGAHRLLKELGDESNGQSLLLIASAAHQTGKPVLDSAQFEDFVGRSIDLSLPHAGSGLAASLLSGALNANQSPDYAHAVARLGNRILGVPEQIASSTDKGLAQRLSQLLGISTRGTRASAPART